MNHYTYAIIALDIAHQRSARERSAEAERIYLASQLAAAAPARRSTIRRPAARFVAAFSRGSASVVRRLDECVADDLGRTLAPVE